MGTTYANHYGVPHDLAYDYDQNEDSSASATSDDEVASIYNEVLD
jgi:hypothetical protein